MRNNDTPPLSVSSTIKFRNRSNFILIEKKKKRDKSLRISEYPIRAYRIYKKNFRSSVSWKRVKSVGGGGGIIITQLLWKRSENIKKKKKRKLFSHPFSFYPPLFRESSEIDFISGDRRGEDIREKKKKRPRYSINLPPRPPPPIICRIRVEIAPAGGSLNFTSVLLNGQPGARGGDEQVSVDYYALTRSTGGEGGGKNPFMRQCSIPNLNFEQSPTWGGGGEFDLFFFWNLYRTGRITLFPPFFFSS